LSDLSQSNKFSLDADYFLNRHVALSGGLFAKQHKNVRKSPKTDFYGQSFLSP